MKQSARIKAKNQPVPSGMEGREVGGNARRAMPRDRALPDLDGLAGSPGEDPAAYDDHVALIAAFPAHPGRIAEALAAAPPLKTEPQRRAGRRPPARLRAGIAAGCSLLFHAAIFTALLVTFVVTPQDPAEEAGNVVSVVMLGDADLDQAAAGKETGQSAPQPEEVVADAVQPDTLQPSDAEPAETQPMDPQTTETVAPATATPQDVQSEDVEPAEGDAETAQPDTVATSEPEILTASVPAESAVLQPSSGDAAAARPIEAVAQATEVPPVEMAAVAPLQPVPDRPAPAQKPAEKKPVRQKPPAKPQQEAKAKAGSAGQNARDAKKGSAEGTQTAEADQNSEMAAARSGAGSAAVANYPGKVQSSIRRSVRIPEEYRRMNESRAVRVRLTIGAGGELAALSVVRGSGIADLDDAVLDGVRRAAPFPPLPAEWGKPSWSFTQEVQVTDR